MTGKPGAQKTVFITVKVGEQAVPGEYKLEARVTRIAATSAVRNATVAAALASAHQ